MYLLNNLKRNKMKNKIDRIKIPVSLEPDTHRYRLVRERDGLTKTSTAVKWVEFDENGKYKADFQEVAISRSLMMSPFNVCFTWLTTLVTEILEEKDNYIKFATENSIYELFKE